MTHYDITIGNDIAKDVHCDIIMGHEVVMGAYHDVTMLVSSFIMYYYTLSGDQVHCFCVEIFHSSFRLMIYSNTKIIHLDLQTRIHHSLVLVIIPVPI